MKFVCASPLQTRMAKQALSQQVFSKTANPNYLLKQLIPMENYTSISSVDGIAKLNVPPIRNLQITQSYHELSLLLSSRIGPCANWCTFATWASKQAGQTIRQEDLSRALQKLLKSSKEVSSALTEIIDAALAKGTKLGKERITEIVWDTLNPKAAMERAGAAVARGNQKVYAEIAREFARFAECCMMDEVFDANNIATFCAELRPGDPPNGQHYLRHAFMRYYQALFEPSPKAKAELILLANLEIGFHEQTRLQPEIAEALEAAVEDPKLLKSKLLDLFFPSSPWVRYVGPVFTALFNRPSPLEEAIVRFAKQARHRLRLILTDHFMELGFPQGACLPLGEDLKAKFPAVLERLENPDLLAFLKKIDPTPDSPQQTGTIDWADLPDRLHFIADLFRCFHDAPILLSGPFTTTQVEAIKTGQFPEGKL